jgi:hypothetical protein
MRYLKSYKIFESIDESNDLFGSLLINIQSYSFPYDRDNKINIYVIHGERIEHSDHHFLKELYYYRSICNEVYNKEYFYIDMDESTATIVLFDYKGRFGINYMKYIRSSYFIGKLPSKINQILDKASSDWRGFSALQSGINYKNGDSSNLALFDWKYGHESTNG